jgi:hypothetical protein
MHKREGEPPAFKSINSSICFVIAFKRIIGTFRTVEPGATIFSRMDFSKNKFVVG